MASLADDLRQAIERDQWVARPLLHDLVDRLPRSVEARALLAQSYLRSLEAQAALDHYRIAHELDPQEHRHPAPDGPLRAPRWGITSPRSTIFLRRQCTCAQRAFAIDGGTAAASARPARRGDQNLIRTCSASSSATIMEVPHALRGLALALRDAGMPLASDRLLSELINLYRLDPRRIARCCASATIRSTIPAGRNSPPSPSWRWRCAARQGQAVGAAPSRNFPDARGSRRAARLCGGNPGRCSSPSRAGAPAGRT